MHDEVGSRERDDALLYVGVALLGSGAVLLVFIVWYWSKARASEPTSSEIQTEERSTRAALLRRQGSTLSEGASSADDDDAQEIISASISPTASAPERTTSDDICAAIVRQQRRQSLEAASAEPSFKFRPDKSDESELERLYELDGVVGRGYASVVRKARERTSGRVVAIKGIKTSYIGEHMDKCLSEVNLMRQLDHPNCVRVFDVFQSTKRLYIVQEYMEGGELLEYIVQKGSLSEREACGLFRQILKGLDYLHNTKNIIHRDIKPENLLITSDASCVKIADFGFANTSSNMIFETLCGTPAYAAPEVFSSEEAYGKSVDVWSCGIVLYIMLLGNHPFEEALDDFAVWVTSVRENGVAIPGLENIGAPGADLIRRMLTVDPGKRITIREALQHPFISDSGALNEQPREDIVSRMAHAKHVRRLRTVVRGVMMMRQLSTLRRRKSILKAGAASAPAATIPEEPETEESPRAPLQEDSSA